MKLFYGSGSPYVRKCRIVVREKGLLSKVEEIPTQPMDNSDEFVRVNPLAQIPALITDEGVPLYDSPLICDWLDKHSDQGPILMPSSGPEHWATRRLETLGDGLLEMLVKMVLENRRPESERSATWLARWQANLMRGLLVAEKEAPSPEAPLNMGSLTLGVLATYLEFRFPYIAWADQAPRLKALQAQLEKRPSFIDTYPK